MVVGTRVIEVRTTGKRNRRRKRKISNQDQELSEPPPCPNSVCYRSILN